MAVCGVVLVATSAGISAWQIPALSRDHYCLCYLTVDAVTRPVRYPATNTPTPLNML